MRSRTLRSGPRRSRYLGHSPNPRRERIHEHQHLWPWLCRGGVARLPRPRWTRGDRRRHRREQAGADPTRHQSHRRGGDARVARERGGQRARQGIGRGGLRGAELESLPGLRRDPSAKQRQPGPSRPRAPVHRARRGPPQQAGLPRNRHSLHRGAGNRRRHDHPAARTPASR
jgi:hypothetical protein